MLRTATVEIERSKYEGFGESTTVSLSYPAIWWHSPPPLAILGPNCRRHANHQYRYSELSGIWCCSHTDRRCDCLQRRRNHRCTDCSTDASGLIDVDTPATDEVLTFEISNTGNGTEDFTLVFDDALAADQQLVKNLLLELWAGIGHQEIGVGITALNTEKPQQRLFNRSKLH